MKLMKRVFSELARRLLLGRLLLVGCSPNREARSLSVRLIICMQLLVCVAMTAVWVPRLADLRDQTIVNWLILPSLLMGVVSVMLL